MKKILFTTALFILGTLFTSCNKNEIQQGVTTSKDQFHSVLRMNMNNVGAVPIGGGGSKNSPLGELQTIYLDIPELTPEILEKIEHANSIGSISDLIVNSGAILEFTNFGKNVKVQFDIPVKEAEKSLDPMIVEAKKYLYSKGFSEQELQTMIATEEATEYDLIPLVIFLQETEFSQNENPFFQCAEVVIGADIIGVPSPSKTAINQMFSASVSKASGPVAAAIAVGNYMQCLYKEMGVLAETMFASKEFEIFLEKEEAFLDMLSIENYSETQVFADLLSVTTKAEFINWIEHNLSYTKFKSAQEASSLHSAMENQLIATKAKFVSPRVQKDIDLFEEQIVLGLEGEFGYGEDPRRKPFIGCRDTHSKPYNIGNSTCYNVTTSCYFFWIRVSTVPKEPICK
ncbi:MAG: hypothetical protein FWE63_08430 [Bacteroidales bacterium]|nr:hypothetical protein [Bacteroidales bacterium]